MTSPHVSHIRRALGASCAIATLCLSTLAHAQAPPPPPPLDEPTREHTEPPRDEDDTPARNTPVDDLELPPPLESDTLRRPGDPHRVTSPELKTPSPKLELTAPTWRPISQRHASLMYLSSLAGTLVGGGVGIAAAVGLSELCWSSTDLECVGIGSAAIGTVIGISAISLPIWVIGHYADYDGTFIATASGASVGTILGIFTIGFSFAAAFNSGRSAPVLGMLAGAAMPSAGALLGYSISHRRARPKQLTAPTFSIAPTNGGGMIGFGFRF